MKKITLIDHLLQVSRDIKSVVEVMER